MGNSGIYKFDQVSGKVIKVSDAVAMVSYDVYFRKPYFDEHLGNEKYPRGQWIESKSHKARILRENGLREAGDARHGARNFDAIRHRIAKENGGIL